RQTRFYQDVFEEGKQEGRREVFEEGREEGRQEAKLEVIPQLLALGLSIEQIAQVVGLDEQLVRQAAQPKS
ncbi:MAG: Rpn family recombination-promoting nuclease/putative transposase, partial [Nostoc sp.]